jgi:hypothetical protein
MVVVTMSQRFNFKLMCHDCGVIYLHIPTGVTNGTVIHCSQCRISLGTWDVLRADFIAQAGMHGILSWMKGRSYAENDAMRIEFDDDPDGRPSMLSFCIGGILSVLMLLAVASYAGYLW